MFFYLTQLHIEFRSCDFLLSGQLLINTVDAERGSEGVKSERIKSVISRLISVFLSLNTEIREIGNRNEGITKKINSRR